jgi:hypothetical protein
VEQIAISPDRKLLAYSLGDKVVLLGATTGKELGTLRKTRGDYLAFLPDGKTLLTAARAERPLLWNVTTGKRLPQPQGHDLVCFGCALSPDGKTIAVSDGFGLVHLLDRKSGRTVRALTWPGPRLGSHIHLQERLAFSPDASMLALANSRDTSLRVWNLTDGEELMEARGRRGDGFFEHLLAVSALSFSPDDRTLVSSGGDGRVRIWEVLTAQERFTLGQPARLGYFPPSGHLALAGDSTAVLLVGARPPAVRRPIDLRKCWDDLAGKDAARASRAIAALEQDPRRSIPFLTGRLKPVPSPDASRLGRLVRELDSDEYAVRQRASRELAALGALARPALLAARRGAAPEVRLRVDRLLKRLRGEQRAPEFLRCLRAIEAVEHARTPAARELLRRLARGADGAVQTQHARAALRRLGGTLNE